MQGGAPPSFSTRMYLRLEVHRKESDGSAGSSRAVAVAASASVDPAAIGSPSGPAEDGELEEEPAEEDVVEEGAGDEDEGGTTVDYMLAFVRFDYEFFRDWRL